MSSITGLSQAQEQVTINLNWYHQFQFAGIYAAKELGYYEEKGLDVVIQEGDGKFDINWVLNDKARYGFALSSQLLNNSKRNDLLIVAVVFQQSHISLATRKKDSIKKMTDLAGKTVNVGPELLAMLKASGVDLTTMDIKGPLAYLNNLEDSSSQAVPYSMLDLHLADGKYDLNEYQFFKPIDYGLTFYGDCLYTSQQELKSNPDRVEAMNQATLRGWQYAIDHPDEVIDLIIEKYGWTGSRESLEQEAQIVIHSLIIPSLYELGFSDKNKWAHMAKVFLDFDLITDDNIDFDKLIYTTMEERQTESMARLTTTSIIIAIALLVIGAGLLGYNYQLRKIVQKRTKDLYKTNLFITEKNNELAIQKADLEKLNYFKGRILTILTHDVRGPLNSFSSVIELVSKSELDFSTIRQLLIGTGAQIEQVTGFIDSLLHWSKNQLHGINVKMEETNLSKLVDKTIGVLTFAAEAKQIHIKNQVDSRIEVVADPTLLSTTLRNLISNAIKFCSQEDVVEILAESKPDQVKISVKDNGPGMTPQQVNSCFSDLIYSTQGTNQETGSGFGLLMCKEFVELNEGEIWVESELERGTTFSFTVKKAEA